MYRATAKSLLISLLEVLGGIFDAAMYEQHQITKTLTSAVGISRLRRLVDSEDFPTRTALSRRVCSEFGFVDASWNPQILSCVAVLGRLESKGLLSLPALGAPVVANLAVLNARLPLRSRFRTGLTRFRVCALSLWATMIESVCGPSLWVASTNLAQRRSRVVKSAI